MSATLPRRARLAAGCVLAATAVLLSACSGSSSPPPRTSSSSTTVPTAPVSTPTTPSATTSTPSGVHEVVAAAAPTRFAFRGKGFTIRASVCGMENVRPPDPPGDQHHTVCWVQHDFGYAPGSSARGTTYVLGHSWAEDPSEVLNKVSERATRELVADLRHKTKPHVVTGQPTYPLHSLDGSVMTLVTPNGRLTYAVRSAFAVRKSVAGFVKPLVDQSIRNRVVLITCGELNGIDYDYNIVVEGYLTSSRATHSHV